MLNQVDRLSPVSEWQPPYDLATTTARKGQIIKAAVDYNQTLLQFLSVLPVCISDSKPHYNVRELEALIDQYYAEGAQAQLNRRRLEANGDIKISEQFKRVYQSGKSLFKLMRR